MGFLRNRMREPSTWAGLGTILANAAQAYQAGGKSAATGALLMGLFAVFMPEQAVFMPEQAAK